MKSNAITSKPSTGTIAATLIMTLYLLVGGGLFKPAEVHSRPVDYNRTGEASYYADKYQARKTASGVRLDNSALTGAHKTLPFGTRVLVTNLQNSKSVTVTINDRGPFVKGRVIDLTRAAFSKIGNLNKGVIQVRIEVIN